MGVRATDSKYRFVARPLLLLASLSIRERSICMEERLEGGRLSLRVSERHSPRSYFEQLGKVAFVVAFVGKLPVNVYSIEIVLFQERHHRIDKPEIPQSRLSGSVWKASNGCYVAYLGMAVSFLTNRKSGPAIDIRNLTLEPCVVLDPVISSM